MPKKVEIVEMPMDLRESEATANVFGIPKRAWRGWNDQARFIFNSVMNRMADQRVVKHPKQESQPSCYWDTIRHNAAWLAAEAAMKSVKR